MHTILLMRHAKSSWKESDLSDEKRPLNKRGRLNAPEMGKRLKIKGYGVDMIISSTAVRALKTAEIISEVMGYEGKIVQKSDLYMASENAYMDVLASLDEKTKSVMIVSHNPGTEWIIEYLSGRTFEIPTAAYVRLGFKGKWKDLGENSCKVLDYDFPKSERSR